MTIKLAHVRIQTLNCMVFEADSPARTPAARSQLLSQLTAKARQQGLAVDKAALAFAEAGQIRFFGSEDLVRYLAQRGVPRWTHTLSI